MPISSHTERKPRKGYLLIFFSLVILMMFIPLWVRMVERDIAVRQDVRHRDMHFQGTFALEGELRNHLYNSEENGLGYFSFRNKSEAEGYSPEGPTQLDYDIIGASVIPVPTNSFKDFGTSGAITEARQDHMSTFFGSHSAKCHTYSDPLDPDSPRHGAYKNCNATVDPETHQIKFESDELSPSEKQITADQPVKFYYTVPALGTGQTNANCVPSRLQIDMRTKYSYNGKEYFVDPLDHACNWERLEKGEVTAIPLFIRNPENPTEIYYPDRNVLSLRFRFKCINGRENCHPSQRPELSVDQVDQLTSYIAGATPVTAAARQQDETPRLIDYALVEIDPSNQNQTYFRPLEQFALFRTLNNKYFRAYDQPFLILPEERRYTNYEFSQLRARYEPFGRENYQYLNQDSIFLYSPQRRISSLNLITFNNRLRPENLDRVIDTSPGLGRHFNIAYQHTQELSRDYQFYSSTPAKQIYKAEFPFEPEYEPNQKELYLVFRFENTKIKSNKIMVNGNNINLDLRQIEFQLISDAPLGNNRMVVMGAAKHPAGNSWQSLIRPYTIEQKDMKNLPRDTGIVFSN